MDGRILLQLCTQLSVVLIAEVAYYMYVCITVVSCSIIVLVKDRCTRGHSMVLNGKERDKNHATGR